MKVKREIIEIDEDRCDGCGQCVPACAEGAIEIVDGKARLIGERYCDGLGACLGECPSGALSIGMQDSEEFDEQAVEEHLKELARRKNGQELTMACGCPSSQIQSFAPAVSCQEANEPVLHDDAKSHLGHWPVQIRLVPPDAPFLKNAELLVAADCTPVAYPAFHRDFLQGKAVMLGCPKFDDAEAYAAKFAAIFKAANIKSVTVLDMEVPCCSALPAIVKQGMQMAGKQLSIEEIVISRRGAILDRKKPAAQGQ